MRLYQHFNIGGSQLINSGQTIGIMEVKFNKKDCLAPFVNGALPGSKLRFDVFWDFPLSGGLESLKNGSVLIRNGLAKLSNAAAKLINCSVLVKNESAPLSKDQDLPGNCSRVLSTGSVPPGNWFGFLGNCLVPPGKWNAPSGNGWMSI